MNVQATVKYQIGSNPVVTEVTEYVDTTRKAVGQHCQNSNKFLARNCAGFKAISVRTKNV